MCQASYPAGGGPLTLTQKQIEEHTRRDVIQAAVLLVSARFGEEAGRWLLAEFGLAETPKPTLARTRGNIERDPDPASETALSFYRSRDW